MVLYQFKLGGGWLNGSDARPAMQNPALWLSIGSLFGAFMARWWFLPKEKDLRRILVLLVIGMALSESVVFFEIFLFPRDMPGTKMGLFVLSLGSALQFMPIYAREEAQHKNG